MQRQYQSVNDAAGLNDLQHFLRMTGLPHSNLTLKDSYYLVLRHANLVTASGGLELDPPHALLRSVAVGVLWRNQGIANDLVEKLLQYAAGQGVESVFLLTETATDYFQKRRFVPFSRSNVPPSIAGTDEFRHGCPDSANCMVLSLSGK